MGEGHVQSFSAGAKPKPVNPVCARAAETCSTWPRSREEIRWHFADPAVATGTEEQRLRIFRRVRNEVQQRLLLMMRAAKIPMKLPKAAGL